MFNTTKTILDNNTRNLIKKIREAPILYSFFGFMIFFSIVTFAYGTYFSYYTEIDISVEEAFYALFMIFMLKSSVDFYNNYIKPGFPSYALTTQIDQRDTINEIFLSVLVTQLLIWFSLSIPFLIILSFLRQYIYQIRSGLFHIQNKIADPVYKIIICDQSRDTDT